MSELIVIGYDDEETASRVLNELQELQRDYLVDLEDAAIIKRNRQGKIQAITTDQTIALGTVTGMFWGTLIGLLFLAPIAGFAIGGLIGAATGSLGHLGIKEDFKREFADMVQPGTSAIMAVIRRATPDKVIEEIKPYGGKILRTSLSAESEEKLMDMLYGEERHKGAA